MSNAIKTDPEAGTTASNISLANAAQQKAADPAYSIWVSASAGSGKTTVLTRRILRLLLPDNVAMRKAVPPSRILAITFTKAGAANMALAIQAKLSKWATCTDTELESELNTVYGAPPDATLLKAARRLFSEVLEAPQSLKAGLQIMTIHSFCGSILSRFPVEAGLRPGFTMMEEDDAAQVLNNVILNAFSASDDKELNACLTKLADVVKYDKLLPLLKDVCAQADKFEPLPETYDLVYRHLAAAYGVPDNTSLASAKAALLSGLKTMAPDFDALALNKKGREAIDALKLFLKGDTTFTLEGLIADKFFSSKGEPYNFTVKTTTAADSAVLETLYAAFMRYNETKALLQEVENTAALVLAARHIAARYRAEKSARGALDFNDLIAYTRRLLAGTNGHHAREWVLYKLDGGIDHILLDEAQDTSPEQWDIVKALTADIFSGNGRDEFYGQRSQFVVGDKKQSIFSFLGADADNFERVSAHYQQQAEAAELSYRQVPMNVSFRTALPILQVVDKTFSDPFLNDAAGSRTETISHSPAFPDKPGGVELWPLVESELPEKEKAARAKPEDGWKLPFEDHDKPATPSYDAYLANKIARHIKLNYQNGVIRDYGDVMILVKSRTALVKHLMRELKRQDIEVSGLDRLNLAEAMAVRDLLCAANFALQPDDDMMCARLLKTPFIEIDDHELEDLALKRGQTSLYSAVLKHGSEKTAGYLTSLIDNKDRLGIHAFFEWILQSPTAWQKPDIYKGGEQALIKRLGHDIKDAVEEFLTQSLRYESTTNKGLSGFTHLIETSSRTIKREMDEGGMAVRIMTVHASKGLEAPYVYLADSDKKENAGKISRFLWLDEHTPIWSAHSDARSSRFNAVFEAEKTKEAREDKRLLYVAMTRAKERLVICGRKLSKNNDERPIPLWYTAIKRGLEALKAHETEDGRLIYESEAAAKKPQVAAIPNTEDAIPHEYLSRYNNDDENYASIAPSKAAQLDEGGLSPLETQNQQRYQRGLATHRLFEYLPSLNEDKWHAVMQHILSSQKYALPEKIQNEIAEEVIKILKDPVFAPVFEKNALVEVPITGLIGQKQRINGQIDRLLITDHEILIVDYKTNRPSPRHEADVPQSYITQLHYYARLLRAIYPDKPIKAALLWTDAPKFMPIELNI